MLTGNSHLTALDPVFDEKVRHTVPGMANWSEPTSSARCGECKFWFDEKGGPRARRCMKYSMLMSGARGARVPRETIACRYFDKA
jgi:hypothetical protein